MENRWSDENAAQFAEKYGKSRGEDLAMGLYVASILGADENLVLHGGGNSSVKTTHTNILGETSPAIYVKASGINMAFMEPDGYTGLDLGHLRKLRSLPDLSDEEMVNEFRTHLLDARSAAPSMETLVHVFIDKKFVDHTHPDAILALSNQIGGRKLLEEAMGEGVVLLPYSPPGFKLAKALAAALDQHPAARAIVLMQHGLITWGETARGSYETTLNWSKARKDICADTPEILWFPGYQLPCRKPGRGSAR